MSKQETISVQPDYVLVERPRDFHVVWSDQQTKLNEIWNVCNQAGLRKVLILGPRTNVKLSTSDIFDLGEKIAELGLQIAVVELHDASEDDVRFLETVAMNRGGPIQFFDNESQAKSGLGSTRHHKPWFVIPCLRDPNPIVKKTGVAAIKQTLVDCRLTFLECDGSRSSTVG